MSDILQLKSINEELFAVRDAYKIGIYKLKIRTNLQQEDNERTYEFEK